MASLDTKAILVTGGSSGIGEAIARRCVNEGARVAITGRDDDRLRGAAETIGALPIRNDAADVAQAAALADDVRSGLGRLDGVVFNAGIAAFLLSNASSFITGKEIVADGGGTPVGG